MAGCRAPPHEPRSLPRRQPQLCTPHRSCIRAPEWWVVSRPPLAGSESTDDNRGGPPDPFVRSLGFRMHPVARACLVSVRCKIRRRAGALSGGVAGGHAPHGRPEGGSEGAALDMQGRTPFAAVVSGGIRGAEDGITGCLLPKGRLGIARSTTHLGRRLHRDPGTRLNVREFAIGPGSCIGVCTGVAGARRRGGSTRSVPFLPKSRSREPLCHTILAGPPRVRLSCSSRFPSSRP